MQQEHNSEPLEQGARIEVLLRRRGLHPASIQLRIGDPRVIQWRGAFLPPGQQTDEETFSAAMSDTTIRKVLRSIISGPRTMAQLRSICGDEEKLASLLAYLTAGGIVVCKDDHWMKGPECEHIDNTGPTFEWAVAEWFRRELQAPVGRDVKLQEVQGGGDLDVVAFVGDALVFVECKTGKPESITEHDIRWFLQRAYDTKPEVAVLLIDTPDLVVEPTHLVEKVYGELSSLERGVDASSTTPETPLPTSPREVPGYRGLYWATPNVFLTGVSTTIDASMSQVLRFYSSYVRHQHFAQIVGIWDFVHGTVQKDSNEPFAVEGQIWFHF